MTGRCSPVRLLLILPLATGAGCGGGENLAPGSATTPVASIIVSPGSAAIVVGTTVQLTATPKDATGNTLTGRTIVWASTNVAVATVSSTGLVTAVGTGAANATASSEGKSGTAAISVTRVATGQLALTISTSGASVDPDGYTVSLDGNTAQPVGINAAVTFADLAAGNHVVVLGGIASNCNVGDPNPRTVVVPPGGIVQTTFAVSCSSSPPPPPPLPNCTHTGDVTRTPAYQPYKPLMAQVVPAGPLSVTSTQVVAGCALLEAGYMLQTMLRKRPDVASALRQVGTLTAIIGKGENVCDLPYFSDLKGQPPCSNGEGGLGGVPGRYATACSERNLTSDPTDPFKRGQPDGENTCVHELGHTTMNIGLSDADRTAIRQRFDAVKSEGKLWTHDAFGNPTFALTNADEFWAEMTQTYFCANPSVATFLHNGINCADQLQQYDPATFALLDGIYNHAAADLR